MLLLPRACPARYTRVNPFLLASWFSSLAVPNPQKDTRHFELDLGGWGLSFEVGDSLAVYHQRSGTGRSNDQHATLTGEEKFPRPERRANDIAPGVAARLQHNAADPKFLRAIAERASAAPYVKVPSAPDRNTTLRLTSGALKYDSSGNIFCPFRSEELSGC